MLRTLVNVEPTTDFRSFEELFERLFGSPSRPVPGTATLPIDVVERDGNLLVKAAVPGVNPEELEITVEKNVLSIRGESKHDVKQETDKVYRREVSYGSFSRSLRLPENLNLEAIDAQFSNGIVTVTIPRIPEPKPQSLRVPVKVSEKAPVETQPEPTE
jgi:HSP20 family protein